jgi:hypothetical protein
MSLHGNMDMSRKEDKRQVTAISGLLVGSDIDRQLCGCGVGVYCARYLSSKSIISPREYIF